MDADWKGIMYVCVYVCISEGGRKEIYLVDAQRNGSWQNAENVWMILQPNNNAQNIICDACVK